MSTNFKFLRPSALALALLAALAAPVAHATPETWAAGSDSAKGVSGSVTLTFSSLMVAAMNTMSWKVEAGTGSTLAVATSTNSAGMVRYTRASVSAPVTTLTGEVSGDAMNVSQLTTGLSLRFTSPLNSASIAPGSLSLSNFTLDLGAKTVYADVLGANGVGALSQYAVWTFSGAQGGATALVPSVAPSLGYTGSFATLGLFLPTASFTNVFSKAMGSNGTGRSILTSVNTPSNGGGQGFGSFGVDLTRVFTNPDTPPVLPDTTPSGIASPVPEPGGMPLVLAALGCVALSRRQARR